MNGHSWKHILRFCGDSSSCVLILLNGKAEERFGCNWFYIGGFVIILKFLWQIKDDALRSK